MNTMLQSRASRFTLKYVNYTITYDALKRFGSKRTSKMSAYNQRHQIYFGFQIFRAAFVTESSKT